LAQFAELPRISITRKLQDTAHLRWPRAARASEPEASLTAAERGQRAPLSALVVIRLIPL